MIVARTAGGDVAVFDVADNEHVDGILDLTVVPARVSPLVADEAGRLRRIGWSVAGIARRLEMEPRDVAWLLGVSWGGGR